MYSMSAGILSLHHLSVPVSLAVRIVSHTLIGIQ